MYCRKMRFLFLFFRTKIFMGSIFHCSIALKDFRVLYCILPLLKWTRDNISTLTFNFVRKLFERYHLSRHVWHTRALSFLHACIPIMSIDLLIYLFSARTPSLRWTTFFPDYPQIDRRCVRRYDWLEQLRKKDEFLTCILRSCI